MRLLKGFESLGRGNGAHKLDILAAALFDEVDGAHFKALDLIGYLAGKDDDRDPGKNTVRLDGLQKCTKATHSEINALLQATPQDRENATLYCTCYPCSKCQLAILNSGVTTVIYDEKHHSEIDFFKGRII